MNEFLLYILCIIMHHHIESRLTITIYIVEIFISYLNPEENITEKDTNTHNILYFIKYNNSQKIMFL